MSSKYAKIIANDVFHLLVGTQLDFMCQIDGTINLVNIASLLHTSRYQVKKLMDYLVRRGAAKYNIVNLSTADELYRPYCGYKLTDWIKTKETNDIPEQYDRTYILQCKAYYQSESKKNDELISHMWDNIEMD